MLIMIVMLIFLRQQVENYSIRLQAAEREGKGLGDEV